MAYEKTEWTARQGVNLNRFAQSEATAESVILENTPDSITVPGTPISTERMNHIEQGIGDAHDLIAAEAQARNSLQAQIDGKAPANAALTATSETGTDTSTGAVASEPVGNVLQKIWNKIRQVANALNSVTKSQVGLGNADNTSDADKPVSAAAQAALNLKEDKSSKGNPNGYASLDGNTKIPLSQLPDAILGQMVYGHGNQF